MYLWMVTNYTRRISDEGMTRKRLVITSRKRAEDAQYRAKQSGYDPEETTSKVQYLGEVPSAIETSTTAKPYLCYVEASYRMPRDPSGQLRSIRVLHEFVVKLDKDLPEKLEFKGTVGPIATGPESPQDYGRLGAVVGTVQADTSQAKDILVSHVFCNAITENDIDIDLLTVLNDYLS